MTNSASSILAIAFGLAVFMLILAVGWRSVQKRRVLRLQGADGQESIIVAREGDDISSVVTTSETPQRDQLRLYPSAPSTQASLIPH